VDRVTSVEGRGNERPAAERSQISQRSPSFASAGFGEGRTSQVGWGVGGGWWWMVVDGGGAWAMEKMMEKL